MQDELVFPGSSICMHMTGSEWNMKLFYSKWPIKTLFSDTYTNDIKIRKDKIFVCGFPMCICVVLLAQNQLDMLSHMIELMKKMEQRGASRYIRFPQYGVSHFPSIAFIKAKQQPLNHHSSKVSAAAGFPLCPAQWQTIWEQPSIFKGFIIWWECLNCRSSDDRAASLTIKQIGHNSRRVSLC